MTAWFGKRAVIAKAVSDATAELESAAKERKTAMEALIAAIRAIPLDSAIVNLGDDLTNVRRDGR